MKHNNDFNDFVIKVMLKHLEKPKFQTNSYPIIKYAIWHKKEFVIKAMLKYLEKIKSLYKLEDIFICAIEYSHEFLIKKILEHPNYKPCWHTFKKLVTETIKYKNIPLIKKMLEHPELKPSRRSLETIVEYATEHNSDLLIEAVLEHLKQYTYDQSKSISYKALGDLIEKIALYAMKYQNESIIQAVLENPFTHSSYCYAFLKNCLKHAIEYNNEVVIQAILKSPNFKPCSYEIKKILITAIEHKNEFLIQAILESPNFKLCSYEIKDISITAIEHQNEFMIKKMLELPKFKPYSNIIETILTHAIEHKNAPMIKKMIKHPKFNPDIEAIKKILITAIEHKNEFVIEKMIALLFEFILKPERPKFDQSNYMSRHTVYRTLSQSNPNLFTDILTHAIKHKNAFVIKKIFELPKNKRYMNDFNRIISGILDFIIETVKIEDLEFKIGKVKPENRESFKSLSDKDLEKKVRTIFISSPILKKCEVKLFYDIEKNEPLKITILCDPLTCSYPPKNKSDKFNIKTKELVTTIINNPYFKKAILPPNIQEKKDLIERVDFVKNKVLEITPKKKGKIMLQGLGLGEFFGPKNITLLSPDAKKLQEIREFQIQFLVKKKLKFKKALLDTKKELSNKIDSLAKLKLFQKQLKQKKTKRSG